MAIADILIIRLISHCLLLIGHFEFKIASLLAD